MPSGCPQREPGGEIPAQLASQSNRVCALRRRPYGRRVPGAGSMPNSIAVVTAAVRSDTPSLPKARSSCVFTVASLMYSDRPISALVLPRATRVSTSVSRADNGSTAPAGGEPAEADELDHFAGIPRLWVEPGEHRDHLGHG